MIPLTPILLRVLGGLLLATCLSRADELAAPLVLENAAVRVVIDPQQGRIMAFEPRGVGRNVLWVNPPAERAAEAAQAGYENWGGDKVWPAAQLFWRFAIQRIWPPDEAVDGRGAVRARQDSPTQAWLQFAVSTGFGTQLEREFSLDPIQPVLRIRNRVTQVQRSPWPAQLWSITQVPLPERVLFDVAADAPANVAQPVNLNGLRSKPPLGPEPFLAGTVTSGTGWVSCRPAAPPHQKLGTLGRWMAGVWPEGVLLQRIEYDPDGLYPEATSLQLYYNERYAELETLGAARVLAVGEVLENQVTWAWLPPPPADATDEAVARQLKTAASAFERN